MVQSRSNSLISRSAHWTHPFVSLLLLAVWLAIPAPAQDAPIPPNLILFVSDDQSPDLGCYGSTDAKTPALDRLASKGLRYTRAYATTASCSASRSVILSGLFNHANGQYGHAHDYHRFKTKESLSTLPQRLAEAGYETIRVGKFHLAPESAYPFETVLVGNERDPVGMAQKVAVHLRKRSKDRPFFLYFCTADPHRGGGFRNDLPYAPDAFGNRPLTGDSPSVHQVDPATIKVPDFLPDTPHCRAELAMYHQSCHRVDQGVEKLLDALREVAADTQTVFLYTADHGMAFPGAKTTLYEAGLHVPLILWDGRKPLDHAATIDLPVTHADLAPTILDYAGVHYKAEDLHGVSHHPDRIDLLPTPRTTYASHTFHEITMYYPMRSVRSSRYKLIWNIAHPLPFPFATDLWESPTWQERLKEGMQAPYGSRTVGSYIQRPKFELYDLVADPAEAMNLAEVPEMQQELKELVSELQAFQKATGDPWILKWEHE
jgi:N-sulfoglucosamine sulfohydrolase